MILFVAALLVPGNALADAPMNYGHFSEIRHERYLGPTGDMVTEYLMYDRTTKLVYYYTICESTGMLSITPYLMRDYYGRITVGLYNKETGGVDPAEAADMVDEDIWEIYDK